MTEKTEMLRVGNQRIRKDEITGYRHNAYDPNALAGNPEEVLPLEHSVIVTTTRYSLSCEFETEDEARAAVLWLDDVTDVRWL
jgi:hypothetical protein